jgi:hypothetical protein
MWLFFFHLREAGLTADKLPVMSESAEEEVRAIGPENIAGHLVYLWKQAVEYAIKEAGSTEVASEAGGC